MPPQGVLELSRIEPGLALQVGCTLSRRGEMIFDALTLLLCLDWTAYEWPSHEWPCWYVSPAAEAGRGSGRGSTNCEAPAPSGMQPPVRASIVQLPCCER
jgi:hypothetical protein